MGFSFSLTPPSSSHTNSKYVMPIIARLRSSCMLKVACRTGIYMLTEEAGGISAMHGIHSDRGSL